MKTSFNYAANNSARTDVWLLELHQKLNGEPFCYCFGALFRRHSENATWTGHCTGKGNRRCRLL